MKRQACEANAPYEDLPIALQYYRWFRRLRPLPCGWTETVTSTMWQGSRTYNLYLESDRYYIDVDLGAADDPDNDEYPLVSVCVIQKNRRFPVDSDAIAVIERLLGAPATPVLLEHWDVVGDLADRPIRYGDVEYDFGRDGEEVGACYEADHFARTMTSEYPPAPTDVAFVVTEFLYDCADDLEAHFNVLDRLRRHTPDKNLVYELDQVMSSIEATTKKLLKVTETMAAPEEW